MSISNAIEELKQGKLIIITDKAERENEADLMFSAQFVTKEKINFMKKHCSGIICVPLTKEKAQELALPQMVDYNNDKFETPFTVSTDSTSVIDGGVSDVDRCMTIKTILHGNADELSKPGHIFPLTARDAGLDERQGHTEATVEMLKVAGLEPVGVICELLNQDGTMMRSQKLLDFALDHGITIVSIEKIIEYKKQLRVEC